MKQDKTIFKDPQGMYSLNIPSFWNYKEKEESDKKSLHQFMAGDNSYFQISVNPIDDRIAQTISEKNIIPHDFTLPNLSFVENFEDRYPMEVYSWMAVVGSKFIFAMYYFNRDKKKLKNLALDLHDVRFSLRSMIFYDREGGDKSGTESSPIEQNNDFSDIKYWRDMPIKYYSSISKKNKFKSAKISPLKVDALKLYALLTLNVAQQPNGFFDMLRVGKPLGNPIWWDFIMECEKGYIQVWRTPFVLEAQYYFDGEFDIEGFLNTNIDRYKKEIDAKIKTFDRHIVYINHYKSYSGCVETLWKEIQQIDLTIPKAPTGHSITSGESQQYVELVETFSANSIRYHALAKSLVLNAAFKIESYLNLVIRIGSTSELRLYPDVLSRFLKLEFSQRVKNLRFYSQIFTSDIDLGSNVYRETKELMTLRNKYVHYEEDAIHNKLGEIFYDRDYPLNHREENRPAIDAIIKTYHHPDINAVRKAYDVSNKFVIMLESLFFEDIKEELQFLISQNPIGYNVKKGIYSVVYTPTALDFFTGN